MCLRPLSATLPPDGGRPLLDKEGTLKLPCGKCTECVSKRACEWATRVEHELSLHDESCFITLTYNDDNLRSMTIVKRDFQLFMKKLRRKLKRKIRYIYCGEYGSKTGRPHFHAIIFGWYPSNPQYLMKTKSGSLLYVSSELESLWDKGFSSIGEANGATAYYIASYALKGKQHILADGQVVNDYMDCSKRPAIGLEYLKENYQQMIDAKERMPRYYLKKLAEFAPDALEEYENQTMEKITQRGDSELYAKYIIDQQKLNSDSEFRTNLQDERIHLYNEGDLNSNRQKFWQRNKK